MKSICVFCGANKGKSGYYEEITRQLGYLLASKNIITVYGAGNVGLMGVLADEVLLHKGTVIGVIPGFLKEKEVCHSGLTKLYEVETMHQRKQKMAELSDGFFILPGGYGTLDEFFEILTWKQLHLHQKPIGMLNKNGYYNHLIKHMDHMVEEGFLRLENRELLIIDDDMERLVEKMIHYRVTPAKDKWLEKT